MESKILKKYNPYEKFRVGQESAIQGMLQAYEDGNKIISLNAPTASGKTIDLYVFGRIMEKEYGLENVTFTSPQVALIESGNLFDLPKLVGKSNYKCLAIEGCDASECPFTSKEEGFAICGDCPYRKARAKFKASKFGATTFARYVQDPSIYSETSVLLIDESSDLEGELLKKATIELNLEMNSKKKATIKDQVIDLQKQLDGFDVKSHLQQRYDELQIIVNRLSTQCKDYRKEIFVVGKKPKSSEIKKLKAIQHEYNHFHRMETACGHALRYIKLEVPYVLTADIEEVYEPMFRKKVFKPVPYFKLLTAYVPFGDLVTNLECVILASGTPTTDLVTKKAFEIKIDHPIPVERRLIHYEPVGSMNMANRETTAKVMAQKIKELHDVYSRKTIVHCGSYAVAQLIDAKLCGIHHNIVLQEQGYREKALVNWQNSDDSIFLSVHYEEGISLDGPEYQMNIVAKVPFPNLSDAWISRRNILDNWSWYQTMTATAVQQACGRTTRGPEDYSDTYILDGSFGPFYYRNKGLFQAWFKNALCWKK